MKEIILGCCGKPESQCACDENQASDRKEYIRDTILAIISFSVYVGLGMEQDYQTPVESYTVEGMEEALDVVNQIIWQT